MSTLFETPIPSNLRFHADAVSIASSGKNTLVSSSNDNVCFIDKDHPEIRISRQSLAELAYFNEKEIAIVRNTWAINLAKTRSSSPENEEKNGAAARKVSPILATDRFWRKVYELLLSRHPELYNILPSIKHQTTSFSGILYLTIMNLENLSMMNSFLENLGRRHSRVFGAEPVFFQYMGSAFIDTLAEVFGDEFSQEIETAWSKLYSFLSNSIIFSGNIHPMVLNNEEDDFNSFMTATIIPKEEAPILLKKQSFIETHSLVEDSDSSSETLVVDESINSAKMKSFGKAPAARENHVGAKPKRSLLFFKPRHASH
ncbi:hypothetical protein DASC09_007550 [Saccharomycopsis crataegensis]|uniref:Globin domain-containing protein n=1 Tax=Saccharomycopsis crataegensis TaxID=43959 RepID=A0AAV5QEP6_9ASCO|nr:hypothetical protein DASC09_007550 [Saccharomycopsis crataegensis]